MKNGQLHLTLEDREWPFTRTDHDRQIVRGVVRDGEAFCFCRVRRDDDFGLAGVRAFSNSLIWSRSAAAVSKSSSSAACSISECSCDMTVCMS